MYDLILSTLSYGITNTVLWYTYKCPPFKCQCHVGGWLFIIGSLLAQTWIDVKINEWYKNFYDLLQKASERDGAEFYDGILMFMKLAIPYVIIYRVSTQTIYNHYTCSFAEEEIFA